MKYHITNNQTSAKAGEHLSSIPFIIMIDEIMKRLSNQEDACTANSILRLHISGHLNRIIKIEATTDCIQYSGDVTLNAGTVQMF